MHTNTIEKAATREVARPLTVLAKLIKQHLAEREEIRDNAAMMINVKIGEELIEARAQIQKGEWGRWIDRNFHLSATSASVYMKAARDWSDGLRPRNLNEVRGDHRRFGHTPTTFGEDIRRDTEQAREQMKRFLEAERDRAAERDAERKLGLKMVSIGFKALSKELHPDKMGGSKEAMQRLNAERDRLNAAA
jgi:hypothetical protein